MLSAYIDPKIYIKIVSSAILFIAMQSCTGNNVYKSNCDAGEIYKHVGFTQLLDSLPYYDNKYVEVEGEYKEGKGESALFNDSLFVDHSIKRALWVNFSQDCPLYLEGTSIGFFDHSNNGELTPINHKTITMRGRINLHYKGNMGQYKGSIDHINYIRL